MKKVLELLASIGVLVCVMIGLVLTPAAIIWQSANDFANSVNKALE